MKNTTLIACTVLITFALTAFTYANWSEIANNKLTCQAAIEIEPPTFIYNVSARTKNTISKERLHNAKTISDLMPENRIQENLKNSITSLRDVKIKIEGVNEEPTIQRVENGDGNHLTKEQMSILKSIEYATKFHLEGYITQNELLKDLNEDRYFNYNMAVVPENQASYKAGNNALIDFLKAKCQPTIAKVQKGNLKPGMISFTVTKAGTISNIVNESTCGYPNVDERMMDLLNNLPNAWKVATNGKGEKVNQTLVFSYGQAGC